MNLVIKLKYESQKDAVRNLPKILTALEQFGFSGIEIQTEGDGEDDKT